MLHVVLLNLLLKHLVLVMWLVTLTLLLQSLFHYLKVTEVT